MAEPPPTYNESMRQQAPVYGGYQTSYGAVPGMPPQTTQPPPAGVYPPYGGPYPPQQPAGAYGKAGGAPVGAGPYPLSQPGYANSNSASYQTNYVYPTQSVVLVGGCPACRVGILEDDFTCMGVVCAIVFFPIGILCCMAMRQRRCANCGAVFG